MVHPPPDAIRKHSLVRRLGRPRRRRPRRLHDMDGPAMNQTGMDKAALTLITFLPAVAAVLLMVFPRGHRHADDHGHEHFSNDKAFKVPALFAAILIFVISLHMPAHFD